MINGEKSVDDTINVDNDHSLRLLAKRAVEVKWSARVIEEKARAAVLC
jgi:hypothetical protein